jgi:hypothetical protein
LGHGLRILHLSNIIYSAKGIRNFSEGLYETAITAKDLTYTEVR